MAHGAPAENTVAVIELEPAQSRHPPELAPAPVGAKPMAVVMGVLLAAVLAVGAIAGHSTPPRPGRHLTFDEPTPAAAPPADTAGAGESAAPVGGALPTRPPHHIPDGWSWRPVGPLAGRQGNVATWTGEVVIFGGVNGGGPQSDGAAYDPATDHWRMIAEGPLSGRVPLASAWTGTELLVVGARGPGLFDGIQDAAAYDPVHDTWRALPGLPMQINDGASVWTGSELIVYGAFLDRQRSVLAADDRARGAALDPLSGHWRDLLPAPLSGQAIALAWDGSEVIAWDHDLDSAAYDPALDAWRALSRLPLEGRDCIPEGIAAANAVFATHCGQAAVFDPHRRTWQAVTIPAAAVDPPVWTGDGLVQWLGPSGRPDDGTWFRPMAP